MSASTVPAVKAALQVQLQARGGLSGVEVSYGLPRSQHKEWIWLADVENHTQEMAAARSLATGGPPRNEEYDLLVVIRTERAGRDQKASDERLYALVDEISQQLRTDPSVSAAVGPSGWAQFGGIPAMQPAAANDGVASKALLSIHVKARI